MAAEKGSSEDVNSKSNYTKLRIRQMIWEILKDKLSAKSLESDAQSDLSDSRGGVGYTNYLL